jgi:hypothetical protein
MLHETAHGHNHTAPFMRNSAEERTSAARSLVHSCRSWRFLPAERVHSKPPRGNSLTAAIEDDSTETIVDEILAFGVSEAVRRRERRRSLTFCGAAPPPPRVDSSLTEESQNPNRDRHAISVDVEAMTGLIDDVLDVSGGVGESFGDGLLESSPAISTDQRLSQRRASLQSLQGFQEPPRGASRLGRSHGRARSLAETPSDDMLGKSASLADALVDAVRRSRPASLVDSVPGPRVSFSPEHFAVLMAHQTTMSLSEDENTWLRGAVMRRSSHAVDSFDRLEKLGVSREGALEPEEPLESNELHVEWHAMQGSGLALVLPPPIRPPLRSAGASNPILRAGRMDRAVHHARRMDQMAFKSLPGQLTKPYLLPSTDYSVQCGLNSHQLNRLPPDSLDTWAKATFPQTHKALVSPMRARKPRTASQKAPNMHRTRAVLLPVADQLEHLEAAYLWRAAAVQNGKPIPHLLRGLPEQRPRRRPVYELNGSNTS